VLRLLGIAPLFDAVYAIEHVRFQPKPLLGGFRRLVHAERLVPHRTVMVDDTLVNLHAAYRLGMRTVWISRASRAPSFVHVRVPSVRRLPRFLDELRAA
jgi:putative hydrolase of the HAD superfamily